MIIRLVAVLAGMAVLAGLAWWTGLPAIGRAFGILGAQGFAFIVLVHVPLVALLAAAWWSAGAVRRFAALPPFVAARMARDAVAELLPFSQLGGFAAGLRVLALTGTPPRRAVPILVADLLMELAAKLPYAMAGIVLLLWLRPQSTLPSSLLLTLFLLAAAGILPLVLRRPLLRLMPRHLSRWLGLGRFRRLLVQGRLVPNFLLHVVCWVLGGAEAWVTLHLMGIAVTAGEAIAIDSLATSLRTFGFFVPAALGVQEVAYVLVCGLFGLDPGTALVFSLVRRARDILLGLTGLAIWQGLEVRHGRMSWPSLAKAVFGG